MPRGTKLGFHDQNGNIILFSVQSKNKTLIFKNVVKKRA